MHLRTGERKLISGVLFLVFPESSSTTKWLEDELKATDSRRGNSGGGGSLQPPPAHQSISRSSSSSMNAAAAAAYNKTTIIPGTSSTLTPIDLSSR